MELRPDRPELTYELNETEHSLRISGTNRFGTPVSGYVKWGSAEEMDANLGKFITKFEDTVTGIEPIGTVDGPAAPGAKSSVRLFRVGPWKFMVLRFTGHEYDEGSVVVLNRKFGWKLNENGKIIRGTFEDKGKRPLRGMTTLFGIGGAHSAWAIGFKKN